MWNRRLMLTNLAFTCAALILLFLSFFSYQRIGKQVQASDEVNKTQLLKFKLNDAFSHLVATESAQRGFVLTGDSVFIADYYAAKQEVPGLLSEIKVLVTKNDQQIANLAKATQLFENRLNFIAHTLAIFNKTPGEELNMAITGEQSVSDELRRQIDHMITVEDQLLQQRLEAKQNEERNTSIAIFLFSLLSIGILVIGFFKMKKEIFSNSLLEERVRERTGELNVANEILRNRNIELKQKNEELTSFTFVANHDLREPLRKIEFFTSRIHDSGDEISPENKILLAKTIQSVKRMKGLLEDVFIYTLTDRPMKFEPTDLNQVAATAINNLKEIIQEKGAVIEYHDLPQIKVVPQHMEQLFTNLLSNSLKYSKKDVKPHIIIKAQRTNGVPQAGYWKISFIDNGIGFNEIYKEKIFELFQRLHPVNEYQGNGVGLTICRKIVENHQGTITASSRIGEGAVFTVLLPAKS